MSEKVYYVRREGVVKMYKIGIIGHSPEHFSDQGSIKVRLNNTLDLLRFQYGDSVIFNLAGEIGIGLWAAEMCMNKETSYYYHLYLSKVPEETSEEWYQDQKDLLKECYNHAHAMTICGNKNENGPFTYKNLIDSSSFVICFWVGKHQGRTYEAIKHALSTNKMVLNGLDELKLITNQDLKKKR